MKRPSLKRTELRLCLTLGLAMASLGIAGTARAMDLTKEVGDHIGGANVSADVTISTGVAFRISGRDCRFIGSSNGGCNTVNSPEGGENLINQDDGNLNFDRWDVVSAPTTATGELDINWNHDFGLFLRGTAFYDAKLDNESSTRRTDLDTDTQSLVGRGGRLLDAYVWWNGELLDHPVNIRAGNQVIQWGQGLFTSGSIASVMQPIDITKLRSPGSSIKEALLPLPALEGSIGLTTNLDLSAYMQFGWAETELDPAGTFFSLLDIYGKGSYGSFSCADPGGAGSLAAAAAITCPGGSPNFSPRIADREPDNLGQFGVALNYYASDLGADLGLYYVRYHSKTLNAGIRAPSLTTGAATYAEYVPRIDMFGASASLPVGNVAVGLEVNYQPETPVSTNSVQNALLSVNVLERSLFLPYGTLTGGAISQRVDEASLYAPGDGIPGYHKLRKWYFAANAIATAGPSDPTFGWFIRSIDSDKIDFAGEVAANLYPNMPGSDQLAFLGPTVADYGGTTSGGSPTRFSWGYQFYLLAPYTNALVPGLTLTPTVGFKHDVQGIGPSGVPFNEGSKSISLGLTGTYAYKYSANVTYTNNFGGGYRNLNADRDFLVFSVSYSF